MIGEILRIRFNNETRTSSMLSQQTAESLNHLQNDTHIRASSDNPFSSTPDAAITLDWQRICQSEVVTKTARIISTL